MLIVLFVIGLAMLIFGMVCCSKASYRSKSPFFKWVDDNDWFYCMLNIVGGVVAGLSLLVIILVGADYSNSMVVDDKIALYEEENTKIEQSINVLVEDYKDYEAATFDKFKLDDPTIVFSLYPELKSNELVSKQIELYVSNNAKIKELRESKLDYKVDKWWLFF